MKKALIIIGLFALVCLGFFAGQWIKNPNWFPVHSSEDKTVLLQEIKDVMKLVTVEGYFSEVYDYKDYQYADWRAFRKKALIRVKAKVSIGYDLEAVSFQLDESSKTLHISGLPTPEIISIDHDLDYYDLQQGSFNTFSVEDYNTLNARAKKFIETQVHESELFDRAKQQLTDVQNIMRHLAESQGYGVDFGPEMVIPNN